MRTRNFGHGLAAVAAVAVGAAGVHCARAQVVISQVYSGAASSQSLFQGDYVELFNRGSEPVSIGGWSIQYASASGSFGQFVLMVPLPERIIPPGRYFLVQVYSPNTPVGAPTGADFTATGPVLGQGVGVNLAAANGKVALVNTTELLPAISCPAPGDERVVDLLGYGSANCAEGTPAPPLTVATASLRANGGCQDTNANAADFASGSPNPRNSGSVRFCNSTDPSGSGSAQPVPACPGGGVNLSFSVTPGTNPPSTGIAVTANLAAIGGPLAVPMVNAGGGVFTLSTVVSGAVNTPRVFSVPVAIADAEGRVGAGNISVEVVDCSLRASASANPPGVCEGQTTVLTVAVTPGMQPASTGIAVSVDLTPVGGTLTVMTDDGLGADAVAGDNVFSASHTLPAGLGQAAAMLTAFISDAQGRQVTAPCGLAYADCVDSGAEVVISQVYGGGGGPGALYRQDFIELFNRTGSPVDLSGWSIQYGGTTGTFDPADVYTLIGTIPAHGYYLIGAIFGAGGTEDLPSTDDFVSVNLFQFNGKLALVRNVEAIGGDCGDADVADLVSFGAGVNCFEGVRQAPEGSNTLGVLRKLEGCQDTNHNGIDFVAALPVPRNSASPSRVCATPPVCPPDFNGDGSLDPDDLSDYIACYFTNPPCGQADVNGDGAADPDDLADYIAAYFAGC